MFLADLVRLLSELPPESLIVLLLLKLVLQGLVPLGHQGLHLVPLALHVLAGQVSVGVDGGSWNVVLLGEVLAVLDEGDDGGELLVGLAKGRLELGVGIDQALDLLQSVHDEHVHQVLPRPVQPVVEGRGALGEFQME